MDMLGIEVWLDGWNVVLAGALDDSIVFMHSEGL